jgi:ABC-type Fe3+-citrate transport system substrate-binding protein
VVCDLVKRSDEAHEKIAAHKDGISKIKKDLKQLKDRVDQLMHRPAGIADHL